MANSITRRIAECDVLSGEAFRLVETGLAVRNPDVEFSDWDTCMKELWRVYAGNAKFQFAVQFAVGDALVFGSRRWGELYAQHLSGYCDYATVVNWMSVSQRVPLEIRRVDLQWSHHREVAYLESDEDKANYLTVAVARGLSSRDLKALVRLDMIERMTEGLGEEERDFWRGFAEAAGVNWRGSIVKRGLGEWMEAGVEEARVHLATLVKLDFGDWYRDELSRVGLSDSEAVRRLAERAWLAGAMYK
jgi:hypothetical protein